MRVHTDPWVRPVCGCEFSIAYEDCSNVYCDSYRGEIGGPRLLCLDCLNKDGFPFNILDLCCSPESLCIEVRVTHRQNIDGPHEPYHRLVKLRTAVLANHFGRTYRSACAAFDLVEEFCAKIAQAPQQPQEETDRGEDAQNASASIPEPTTAEVSSENVKPDGVPVTEDDTRDRTEADPTTTEESFMDNKSDDVPAAADGPKDETETEDKVSQCAAQAESQNGDLPTCGRCSGSLSFPFWYCIFCEGQS